MLLQTGKIFCEKVTSVSNTKSKAFLFSSGTLCLHEFVSQCRCEPAYSLCCSRKVNKVGKERTTQKNHREQNLMLSACEPKARRLAWVFEPNWVRSAFSLNLCLIRLDWSNSALFNRKMCERAYERAAAGQIGTRGTRGRFGLAGSHGDVSSGAPGALIPDSFCPFSRGHSHREPREKLVGSLSENGALAFLGK